MDMICRLFTVCICLASVIVGLGSFAVLGCKALTASSIERTCPDLHFTTDYTLYDCVCDK